MSEAPRVEKSGDEPLPPSNSGELNEIAWQKWINRNKERDAAHQKKVIRLGDIDHCFPATKWND
jgi:hypothetical protein